MDSHRRSLAKSISYRITGTIITFLVAWLVIGSFAPAAFIGILDGLIKIVAYYTHGRIWNRITFGRIKPPEYHI